MIKKLRMRKAAQTTRKRHAIFLAICYSNQRCSPLGRNFKSLTLKVKSLVLNPASPRNCPVLGSRRALFFDWLKMGQGHEQCCFDLERARELAKKNFGRQNFVKNVQKISAKICFFFKNTSALCPWSLALASSVPVRYLKRVCLRKVCPSPWPRIFFMCPWPRPRAMCPRLYL